MKEIKDVKLDKCKDCKKFPKMYHDGGGFFVRCHEPDCSQTMYWETKEKVTEIWNSIFGENAPD